MAKHVDSPCDDGAITVIVPHAMGNKSRHQQAIYLDHDKAQLLDKLAKLRRLPKQQLMREGIDLLLERYGLLKPLKYKP